MDPHVHVGGYFSPQVVKTKYETIIKVFSFFNPFHNDLFCDVKIDPIQRKNTNLQIQNLFWWHPAVIKLSINKAGCTGRHRCGQITGDISTSDTGKLLIKTLQMCYQFFSSNTKIIVDKPTSEAS